MSKHSCLDSLFKQVHSSTLTTEEFVQYVHVHQIAMALSTVDISLCELLVFISLLSFIISLILHHCGCRNEKDVALLVLRFIGFPFYLLHLLIYLICVKCCKPETRQLEELNAPSSTPELFEEEQVNCHQVESTLMNETPEDWHFIGIAPDDYLDCYRHVGRKQTETENCDTVLVLMDPPTYVTRALVHCENCCK